MRTLWTERGLLNETEQRLMDQKNQILKKQCLTELELEKIERAVDDAVHGGQAEVIEQVEHRSLDIEEQECSIVEETANQRDGNNDKIMQE